MQSIHPIARAFPTALCAFSLLTTVASAQNTYLVGPNGVPNIQIAADLAAPGDEIVIEPGTYQPFSFGKPLTVRAQQPGTVQILSTGLLMPNVLATPTDQVRFVGLSFERMYAFTATFTFEDCTFQGQGNAISVNNATAHFERCGMLGLQTFLSGVGPLSIGNATVSMVDCTVEGPMPGVFGISGPSVQLQAGSTLLASDCIFQTHASSSLFAPIETTPGDFVRVSDSTFLHDPSLCPAIGGGDIALRRCVVPGACATIPDVPLLGARAPQPIVRGGNWSADFRGEPNMPMLVFGSDRVEATPSPNLNVPFLLSAAGCFPLAAVMLDQQGTASLSVAVPNIPLPPGVAVFLQGVSGASYPLLASPIVGGVVR